MTLNVKVQLPHELPNDLNLGPQEIKKFEENY